MIELTWTNAVLLGGSALFGASILALAQWVARRPERTASPLLASMRIGKRPPRPTKTDREVVEMDCTECGNPLVATVAQMQPLSNVEKGLVVRSHPKRVNAKLADYDCPYCDAAHCFQIGPGPVQWVGVNFYAPQQKGKRCFECRTLVYEITIDTQATGAQRGVPGITCPYCNALCCIPCYERFTRNQTDDGSYLCPRCGRGPVRAPSGVPADAPAAPLQGF